MKQPDLTLVLTNSQYHILCSNMCSLNTQRKSSNFDRVTKPNNGIEIRQGENNPEIREVV